MPRIEEALQQFWLRDLYRVTTGCAQGLATWLARREFVFSRVDSSAEFSLRVLNQNAALSAFAFDSSRMCCAAIESMIAISKVKPLPRSTAWLVIQAYYAAFFAAHGLLRMFGTMCLQLDAVPVASFDKVARALSCLPGRGFEKGFYVCSYDVMNQTISFKKSSAAKKGSHEVMWEVFATKIRDIADDLLQASQIYTSFAVKLTDLEDNLRAYGCTDGSWLSHVRNLVNYRNEYGTWFPYKAGHPLSERLFEILLSWRKDPMALPLHQRSKNHLETHIASCAMIVSLCRCVAEEMKQKCPKGRSFHYYGCISLMQHAHL